MHPDDLLPSRLPLPPRRVRIAPATKLMPIRIAAFFFLAGTLAALAFFIIIVLWKIYGTNTTGRIRDTYVSYNKIPLYYLCYDYTSPIGLTDDKERVSRATFERFEFAHFLALAPVTVRYLKIGPYCFSGLPQFSGVATKSAVPGFFFFGFGWFAIYLLYKAWLQPAREKVFVQFGIPVLGAITHKRIKKEGRISRYFVRYAFTTNTGTVGQAEMELLNRAQWQPIEIAQIVTVLLHPTIPDCSTIYELTRYRAIV